MLEQLITALTAKYTPMGFSPAVIKALAESVVSRVTEEAHIADEVARAEPLLKAFQSDAERRATAARKKALEKTDPADPSNTPADPTPAPVTGADGEVMSLLKTLAKDVAELKSGKTADTRRTQLDQVLNEAKVTDSFRNLTVKAFDRMAFADEAAFNAYLDELKTDAADYRQQVANDSLRGTAQPGQGSGADGGTKQASKEEVDAILQRIK